MSLNCNFGDFAVFDFGQECRIWKRRSRFACRGVAEDIEQRYNEQRYHYPKHHIFAKEIHEKSSFLDQTVVGLTALM
jgi:hypothetical protein